MTKMFNVMNFIDELFKYTFQSIFTMIRNIPL